jgi:poly(A) polymerase
MSESFPFPTRLPRAAEAAVKIVRELGAAGHRALLAGGCVRDLLLGLHPQDYDVATDAVPDRICELFQHTRKVGAQFGVVLVRKQRRWVEVATFRAEGRYLDGRRPSEVTFSDARHDAARRDFTVNGMFLDPLSGTIIDYVGGRVDLEAELIRAIGAPAERFAEDHLRLVRAVRFAARLGFAIEPATLAALKANADRLATVAAERVREELERMLTRQTRQRAFRLLAETGLLAHLWAGATWQAEQVDSGLAALGRLPKRVSFPLAFAVLLADRRPGEIERIGRALTCSNEQRETVRWLVVHQADLDEPDRISLAELKRLLAHPAFADLRVWAETRYAQMPDGDRRRQRLGERLSAIAPEAIKPGPLVTGDDLIARGVRPGPIYKKVLDELYTRQLDETLTTRDDALRLLEKLLAPASNG